MEEDKVRKLFLLSVVVSSIPIFLGWNINPAVHASKIITQKHA